MILWGLKVSDWPSAVTWERGLKRAGQTDRQTNSINVTYQYAS